MPLVDRIFLPAYVPKLQSVGLVCHVPANDPRPALAPAKALGVMVDNLLVSHRPVYQVASGPLLTTLACSGSRPRSCAC